MSELIVEVSKVEDIQKHPNADKLSIVRIKGWNCIVGLDQYKVGDLVVYIPPDSIMPQDLIDKYGLEYLRSDGRVRTVKLRGCVSQGLVLELPKGNYKEGDDLSGVMNIKKWEPPLPNYQNENNSASKKKSRNNPHFVEYTKAPNIKFYNSIFEEGEQIVITEKIHGTNARFGNVPIEHNGFWQKLIGKIKFALSIEGTHEFIYGSHRVQISKKRSYKGFYGTDVYGQIAERYRMAEIIPEGYQVFGEIYGNKIQDLTYGLSGIELVVFDVMFEGQYLDHDEFVEFCERLKLPMVPILYVGPYCKDTGIIERCTDGKSQICPSQIREGCMVKTRKEVNDIRIGRKILKSISQDYLLRQGATEFH